MHCPQGFPLKKIVRYAAAKAFTDLIVFNEDRKRVNGLLLVHLPAGPTAHFKLSSLVLSKDIKVRPYGACASCQEAVLTVQGPLNYMLERSHGCEGSHSRLSEWKVLPRSLPLP